jgi:hypothetical protein
MREPGERRGVSGFAQKLQAPKTKFQTISKFQIQRTNHQRRPGLVLDIGIWPLEFVWTLVLGDWILGSAQSSKHHETGERMSGKAKRKSPDGVATNDLVFTAHQGNNDELFPQILSLYVAPGSTVADVTYGKGVFWRRVPPGRYRLLASDLAGGVDSRALPYVDASLDCVVFDPPYMHTPGGSAHVNHQNYEGYYGNNRAGNGSRQKYHEAVLDLYFQTGSEVRRVLRCEGLFIVKCADEVCANQQRLTHVEIIDAYRADGFVIEDLFVLVRHGRPGVSRTLRQVHARKNHSYFLVFRKSDGRKRWRGPQGRLR